MYKNFNRFPKSGFISSNKFCKLESSDSIGWVVLLWVYYSQREWDRFINFSLGANRAPLSGVSLAASGYVNFGSKANFGKAVGKIGRLNPVTPRLSNRPGGLSPNKLWSFEKVGSPKWTPWFRAIWLNHQTPAENAQAWKFMHISSNYANTLRILNA